MGIRGRWAFVFICISLSFGSFADEAAQVTFALRLADHTSSVSILLAVGLIGGMLSGPIAPLILQRIGPRKTIPAVFLLQSLLIAAASLANQFWGYIVVSMALGSTGSLLWAAIMVAIPSYTNEERHIDRVNRITQSVRNMGYVGGPALGGLLYGMADHSRGLLTLALLVLVAAPVTALCFKALDSFSHTSSQASMQAKQKGRLDLLGLVRTAGVIRAVAPLLMTVVLTSTLNVLLIFRVRTELQFSAEIYGLVISALSVGLIVGPVIFAGLFARRGDAAGASIAASVIGAGILWLALSDAAWLIMCAAFLIGSANGIQNALTASFMMKAIDPQRRVDLMPAYIFCIQTSVFLGFLSAGMISTAHVSMALVVVGVATAIIGACGIALNVKNRPSMVTKGA
ncbi:MULTISPECIES: MFS transporter [unclassified Burkholderia]|uniref:MFS transporter n=1 Tax=unclassified Burkholderia TaxID=2613784 RepID=UPI000F571C35|nr:MULTISPECIES: MFS transporter [unclassified Burkholderia]RQR40596.1 MFS transporter [Burkholderia sp. Bp9142]RQR57114.1 MFS transporter [Burkholderia sp. Bp9140]